MKHVRYGENMMEIGVRGCVNNIVMEQHREQEFDWIKIVME
jgi:hypothetical protein